MLDDDTQSEGAKPIENLGFDIVFPGSAMRGWRLDEQRHWFGHKPVGTGIAGVIPMQRRAT